MFKDIVTAIFSLIIIVMFGGALYLILVKPPTLTEGQMNLVMIALGVLFSGVNQVLGYYIGSSASSQKKDDTIQQAMLNAGTGNGTVGLHLGTKPSDPEVKQQKPTLVGGGDGEKK
jgi:hypothetical protein